MAEQVGISRDWREPEGRKMVKCWKCEGTGFTEEINEDLTAGLDNLTIEETCPKCDGTGVVEDDPFDRADDNRD